MWGSQLWGDFGWVRIPFAEPVPRILFGVGAAVAVGLAVWLLLAVRSMLRRRRSVDASIQPAQTDLARLPGGPLSVDARLAITAAALVGIVGALYAASWIYYASTGANDLLQGRYALLALPAILAAPVLLLERFWGTRAATVGTLVLAGAMLLLTVDGLDNTMRAFYG
jgi:hypothetical protein